MRFDRLIEYCNDLYKTWKYYKELYNDANECAQNTGRQFALIIDATCKEWNRVMSVIAGCETNYIFPRRLYTDANGSLRASPHKTDDMVTLVYKPLAILVGLQESMDSASL